MILATYNGERYLTGQLRSLARQAYLPSELIIVDDSSTDQTLSIAYDFVKDAPFDVRVIEGSSGLGPTKNFERGMEAAKGEIVFFCDQDDVWLPQKIKQMVMAFGPSVYQVFCNADLVSHDLNMTGETLWTRLKFSVGRFDAERDLFRRTIAFGMSMAYRNDEMARELLFPIPIPFGHDNWTAMIMAALGETKFVGESLVLYRQHDAQVSGASSKRHSRFDSMVPNNESYLAFADRVHKVERARSLRSYSAGKAEHLCERKALQDLSLVSKAKTLVDPNFAPDYWKYSNGWKSLLRDLLF